VHHVCCIVSLWRCLTLTLPLHLLCDQINYVKQDHMVSGDSTRIGFYLVPWSCNASREKEVKMMTKTSCI
jgi:hypothetical protein